MTALSVRPRQSVRPTRQLEYEQIPDLLICRSSRFPSAISSLFYYSG